MEQWREEIKNFLYSGCGKIWYVWGGQNLESNIADCSGLVLEILKKFGVLPQNFGDTTARGLSKLYKITKKPDPGDLAFYGRSWNRVTHVMFYYGECGLDGRKFTRCVAGMCGGRSTMNEKNAIYAKKVGASLWIRTSPLYRNDFLGFRRIQKR